MTPLSLSLSVFGPQGLRLVQVTDVSLLVEWESARGAEYYILTYHPKDDKSAPDQVVFLPLFCLINRYFRCSIHTLLHIPLISTRCIPGPDSQHRELLPHHRTDPWGHLHCPGVRSHQRNPK